MAEEAAHSDPCSWQSAWAVIAKAHDELINESGHRPAKGAKEMSKLRISLLGLVAMCLASMFTAAAASAAGPFWHHNGTKLKQGSAGVKLQSKGVLTLKSSIAGLTVTVTCGRSTGNGTIDGQGETRQGQGKALVKLEQCTVTGGEGGTCRKPSTITTNQLKLQAAYYFPIPRIIVLVYLFEPSPSQQTRTFANILFGECTGTLATLNGINAPVTGTMVGEAQPQEQESQEGSVVFPSEPIKEVEAEGQLQKAGLLLSSSAAAFTGYYADRIQSGTFGIFKE